MNLENIQLGSVFKGKDDSQGCLVYHIKKLSGKAATRENPLLVECMKSDLFSKLIGGDCPNTVENRQAALDLLLNSCKAVNIETS